MQVCAPGSPAPRPSSILQCSSFYGPRAVLLGDSAHAVTGAMRGQGPSSAIESVRTLALVLRGAQVGWQGYRLIWGQSMSVIVITCFLFQCGGRCARWRWCCGARRRGRTTWKQVPNYVTPESIYTCTHEARHRPRTLFPVAYTPTPLAPQDHPGRVPQVYFPLDQPCPTQQGLIHSANTHAPLPPQDDLDKVPGVYSPCDQPCPTHRG